MVRKVAETCERRRRCANQKMHPADDGQMKARDYQHMKGTGAFKAHAQRMAEVGAVAGDHGGQHDGVVLSEAQRAGQAAHGGGQGHQAGAGGVLPPADAAGEKAALRLAYPVNTVGCSPWPWR